MRVTLTPDLIRSTSPGPARTYLWDTLVPGLGLIIHPSGKTAWVFQGAATSGKRRTIAARTLAEARKVALTLKAGVLPAPEAGLPMQLAPQNRLTVNGLLDAWLAAMAERPAPPISLPRIHACMDNHARPRIGNIALDQLRRVDVLDVRDALATRDLRGMANQVTAYMRAALRWAEDARLIPEAPRWRLPRLRLGSRAHSLDDDQWSRLVTVLHDEDAGLHRIGRLALLALILTGCRKGEIAELRHDAVANDGSLLLKRHKTAARSGPKRIPGSPGLSAVLAEARGVVRQMAEAQPTARLKAALLDSPYVFPCIARNAMGKPIGRVLDDVWADVREAAQLPATMTIHGIRGAFITQAQRMGVPVATVAAMVGHESPLTTLRLYTAPSQAEVTQGAQRVAGWIGGTTQRSG